MLSLSAIYSNAKYCQTVLVHFSNRLPSGKTASLKNLPTYVTRHESKMSRRDVKQTGSNTVPLGEAMGRLRLGGGGPSLLNPSYLGGGGSSSVAVVETYETRGRKDPFSYWVNYAKFH